MNRRIPPTFTLLGAAGLLCCALALAGCSDAIGHRSARPPAAAGAPNVVVVMTDDQALDTMRAMPRTRRLLGEGGTTYEQALASFPLCCPSRATFLTGQYAHNHGVRDNSPPGGGLSALDQDETLPVWLQEAGYRTGFVGKYLNGYGKERNGGDRFVPPGWDRWVAAEGSRKTAAFDYVLNIDGELVERGGKPADYKTTVMADEAVRFIGDRDDAGRPFFLWVATSAPHTDNNQPANATRNPIPHPRDRGRFDGARLPRGPAFNERDVSDKPAFVQRLDRLRPREITALRTTYVSQLESLIAVDRLVARIVGELKRRGELDDTIVVFTSDNGFLRGQHRIDSGKSKLFDESVRVPLIIRGPGFDPGVRVRTPVANVDLAPTILAAAKASPGTKVDGLDLRDVRDGNEDRSVLLEVFERRDDRFSAVRDDRWVYAERDGGRSELYDRRRDPAELRNLAERPRYRVVRERLADELRRIRDCRGEECR